MWNRKTVSLIFPTYREKASIFSAIQEFDSTGYIDEIIVVDNNAEEGTESEVKKTRARLIKEPRQGYGRAIRTGIENTKSDLIIIAEPDGTFDSKDVVKLLAYSDDFEMVFGARTHVSLLDQTAEMSFLRRILNYLLGRMVNALFLCTRLTDIGCSLRITSRKSWAKIKPECKTENALFATEWLLMAAVKKIRFIEIPINFHKRVGRSSLTETFFDQAKWGILIFIFVLRSWFYYKVWKKVRG